MSRFSTARSEGPGGLDPVLLGTVSTHRNHPTTRTSLIAYDH